MSLPRYLLPLVALLATVAIFPATWRSMAQLWWDDPTYAHGMIIAPLSMYLVWRMRAALDAVPLRPDWRAIVVLLPLGAAWLVGELAGVNSVAQFAVVLMIPALVAVAAGMAFVRVILYPLLFLLFLVPFGGFLVPPMMEWTADVTVAALRLTGIPVYREALHFTLPTGRWSVIEACSGQRYLIASFVLGTLFAYFIYRSPWRRLAFVVAATVVPLLANWARAYLIVMIGHLSDMRLAVGDDHVFIGWVFFGIVMIGLFWFGARWREDDQPLAASVPARALAAGAGNARTAAGRPALALGVALAVLLGARPLLGSIQDATVPRPFAADLAQRFPTFQPDPRPLGYRPLYRGARAEVVGTIRGAAGEPIGLYAGYYARQHEGGEMIHHSNVLVELMDERWRIAAESIREIRIGSRLVPVIRVVLAGAGNQQLLLYQWHDIDGHHEISATMAKVHTAYSMLRGRGDHSSTTIAWTPIDGDVAKADRLLAGQAATLAGVTTTAGAARLAQR